MKRIQMVGILTALLLPGLAVADNSSDQVDPDADRVFPDGTVQSYGEENVGEPCGCLDLVLVIDDTGSMGGAIANVSAGMLSIITTAEATCTDVKASLITFKDDVTVVEPLGPTGPVVTGVGGLVASGGAGEPEASDEALREAFTATVCALTGDFNPADWRDGCCKVAILVTDARPAGCDDLFTIGTDDVNAHARALDALSLGVQIGALFVPTFGDPTGEITPIMIDYAATTSGVFGQSNSDGSGTADAIEQVILNCTGTGATEFCCLPDGTCVEVIEGDCGPIGGTVVADCIECEDPTPTIESTWGEIKSQYRSGE